MESNHTRQSGLVPATPTQPFSESAIINQGEGQTILTRALSAQNVSIISNPVWESWLTLWFQTPLWPARVCAAGAVWLAVQLTGIIIITTIIIRGPLFVINGNLSAKNQAGSLCAFGADNVKTDMKVRVIRTQRPMCLSGKAASPARRELTFVAARLQGRHRQQQWRRDIEAFGCAGQTLRRETLPPLDTGQHDSSRGPHRAWGNLLE